MNREWCFVSVRLDRDAVKLCFLLTNICPLFTISYWLDSALSCICVCSSELTNCALRICDVMEYLFITQCDVGLYLRSVLAGVMQLSFPAAF
jgi:hypothetical protein